MNERRVSAVAWNEDQLPRPVRVFLSLLGGLSLLCALVEVVCKWVLHFDYPYTWPLMPISDRFRDFFLYRDRFDYFHSAKFFSFDGPGYFYPAPLATLHWLLYQLPSSTRFYLTLLVVAWLAAALLLARLLLRRGVARRNVALVVGITAVCSYPFFFEFEQANLEWILCVLVGGGIVAFLRGRGYTAAACFGVAASMKYYPLILVGLLISRKQYKQAAFAVVVCGVSTLIGLWLLCPDLAVSWRGSQLGLVGFQKAYVLHYEQVGFDHSLVGFMKAVSLVMLPDEMSLQSMSVLLGRYMVLAAYGGLVLYVLVIRKLPVINQIICLTVATIALPPVSYDYTLLHLYLPWALLLLAAVESRDVPGLTAAMVCCAIVFAPVTELIVQEQSYGGQVKALALVGLGLIALIRKFPTSLDVVVEPLAMRD